MGSFESELGRVMRADDLPERPVDVALGDVRRRAGARRRNRTVGVVAAVAASAAVIVGVSTMMGSQPTDVPLGPATEAPESDDGVSPTVSEPTTHVHLAEGFIELAKGRSSNVPWAEEVTYFISGEEVARLSGQEAADIDAWEGCPAAGFYAARDCPVSPVDPVASLSDGEHVFEAAVPRVFPCSVLNPPTDIDHAGVVVIRPPQDQRDCVRDFAVSLYVNRHGDVIALDLVLAEP